MEIEEPQKFIKVTMPEFQNNMDTIKIWLEEFEIKIDENTKQPFGASEKDIVWTEGSIAN